MVATWNYDRRYFTTVAVRRQIEENQQSWHATIRFFLSSKTHHSSSRRWENYIAIKQVQEHRQINQMRQYFDTSACAVEHAHTEERPKSVYQHCKCRRQLFHIYVFCKQADAIWRAAVMRAVIFLFLRWACNFVCKMWLSREAVLEQVFKNNCRLFVCSINLKSDQISWKSLFQPH